MDSQEWVFGEGAVAIGSRAGRHAVSQLGCPNPTLAVPLDTGGSRGTRGASAQLLLGYVLLPESWAPPSPCISVSLC